MRRRRLMRVLRPCATKELRGRPPRECGSRCRKSPCPLEIRAGTLLSGPVGANSRRLGLAIAHGMTQRLCHILVAALAVASPAVAQTVTTPGGTTTKGVVTLGTGSAAPTVAPTSSANPVGTAPSTNSATSAGGGSAGGSTGGAASGGGTSGGQSNFGVGAGVTPSSRATSVGSSGGAVTAPPASAPAWVVCPPSGSSGFAPFLTGTSLSCAP